jgi:hypothetical protein
LRERANITRFHVEIISSLAIEIRVEPSAYEVKTRFGKSMNLSADGASIENIEDSGMSL